MLELQIVSMTTQMTHFAVVGSQTHCYFAVVEPHRFGDRSAKTTRFTDRRGSLTAAVCQQQKLIRTAVREPRQNFVCGWRNAEFVGLTDFAVLDSQMVCGTESPAVWEPHIL